MLFFVSSHLHERGLEGKRTSKPKLIGHLHDRDLEGESEKKQTKTHTQILFLLHYIYMEEAPDQRETNPNKNISDSRNTKNYHQPRNPP